MRCTSSQYCGACWLLTEPTGSSMWGVNHRPGSLGRIPLVSEPSTTSSGRSR